MGLFERAVALLDAERKALRGADFVALEALYESKHELIKEIEAHSTLLSRAQLQALSTRSRGNDRLLDASMRGLRSVARRLSESRRAADHLDTYTDEGKRKDLGPAKVSFERRA